MVWAEEGREEELCMYTHRLRIDYGKLESPVRYKSKGREHSIVDCLNQEEEEPAHTKRRGERTPSRYPEAHSTGKKRRVARITLDTSGLSTSPPFQAPPRSKGNKTFRSGK